MAREISYDPELGLYAIMDGSGYPIDYLTPKEYQAETAAHEIAPAVVLDPDGWFRAIDQNNYDVDCSEDGYFTTSPEGFGRTPLDAIVDLLDNMEGK